MTARQDSLFEGQRLTLEESIQLSLDSLNTYGPSHRHWAIAWSGGKDSTALLTFTLWAITTGRVMAPESLVILYADTRLEFRLLWDVAREIIQDAGRRGFEVRSVMAPVDQRLIVNILGRGVSPPNNMTNRWCTRQIKGDPMTAELERIHGEKREKVLVLTGVRKGESQARDQRIAIACSKDDGECGQGWYQASLPGSLCDKLAPLLHWRLCHVMDWLTAYAPDPDYGGWNTFPLVKAYGDGEARFGCMGCALVEDDTTLRRVVRLPGWQHHAPLLRLQAIWSELRAGRHRLRSPGGLQRQDGELRKRQQRLGPIILESRRWGLAEVLGIQAEVNDAAERLGRPGVDMLNEEEHRRILELIDAGTWPKGWTGEEPVGTEILDTHFDSGVVQSLLPMFNLGGDE